MAVMFRALSARCSPALRPSLALAGLGTLPIRALSARCSPALSFARLLTSSGGGGLSTGVDGVPSNGGLPTNGSGGGLPAGAGSVQAALPTNGGGLATGPGSAQAASFGAEGGGVNLGLNTVLSGRSNLNPRVNGGSSGVHPVNGHPANNSGSFHPANGGSFHPANGGSGGILPANGGSGGIHPANVSDGFHPANGGSGGIHPANVVGGIHPVNGGGGANTSAGAAADGEPGIWKRGRIGYWTGRVAGNTFSRFMLSDLSWFKPKELRFNPTEHPIWRVSDIFHKGISTTKMLDELACGLGGGKAFACVLPGLEEAFLEFSRTNHISTSMLLRLHTRICEVTPLQQGRPGEFRNTDAMTELLTTTQREVPRLYVYLAVDRIRPELEGLLKTVNNLLAMSKRLEEHDRTVMFKIASVFYNKLMVIHPFSDNNGRVGMAMVSVLLRSQLGFYMAWADPFPDDHINAAPHHRILLWCLECTRPTPVSPQPAKNAWTSPPSDLCAWMCESAWWKGDLYN